MCEYSEDYCKTVCICGLWISKQQRNLLLTAGAKTANLLCNSFWGNSLTRTMRDARQVHTTLQYTTHTHTKSKVFNLVFDSITYTYTHKQSTGTQTNVLAFAPDLWYRFLTQTQSPYTCFPSPPSPSLSLLSIPKHTHTHTHARTDGHAMCSRLADAQEH